MSKEADWVVQVIQSSRDVTLLTKPPVKSAAHFKKLPFARFFTIDVGSTAAKGRRRHARDDALPDTPWHSKSISRTVALTLFIVLFSDDTVLM